MRCRSARIRQFLHHSIPGEKGRATQALRATLRERAQANARLLRELDGALPLMAQTEARVAAELAKGHDPGFDSDLAGIASGAPPGGRSRRLRARLCAQPRAARAAAAVGACTTVLMCTSLMYKQ